MGTKSSKRLSQSRIIVTIERNQWSLLRISRFVYLKITMCSKADDLISVVHTMCMEQD